MEKILLINPAHTYYKRTYRTSSQGSIGLPIGLLYIATIMESMGCKVEILDSLVSEFSSIEQTKDYILHGISESRLSEIIKKKQPDIIGISSQFSIQEENVLKTAKLVKNINSSILVIAGGANVSCRGEYLLRNSGIDIGVKGEGENTIREIIEYFRKKKNLAEIRGVFYRKGNQIVESENQPGIENLDEIPLPAYHLVDMEKYLTLYKKGIFTRDRDVKRNIAIITSRGCPYDCIFCSIAQNMGKKWRAHSSEYVIKHIQTLAKTYKTRHLHFEDDNLLFSHQRFLPILDVLSTENISWDTPNGIRVDLSIDENFLQKIRLSGCKSLTIGVESADHDVLNRIVKKNLKLEDVEEFARRCQKVKLPLRAFFILGFPGETIKTMRKTMDFAIYLLKRYNVEIINFIATPLYGTELYRLCAENNYFSQEISAQALSESTVSDGRCLIKTDSFSSKDVERLSQELTAKAYRIMLGKSLLHPFSILKRAGNLYIFFRIIKRIFPRKYS